MITEGDFAPDFVLPGSDGADIGTYRLASFADTGATVLVFYPFDFSPVCTSELCQFRDAEWLTFTPNVDVLGISTDSAYAHRRFITENNLNFPLLSDASSDVIESYGVRYDEWENHREVSKRAMFVLDDEQMVHHRWETEDATEEPDVDAIYETIEALPSVSLSSSGAGVDG